MSCYLMNNEELDAYIAKKTEQYRNEAIENAKWIAPNAEIMEMGALILAAPIEYLIGCMMVDGYNDLNNLTANGDTYKLGKTEFKNY